MAQAESERMRVAMFPWLAHDHINPYLELAKRLIASASDDHHLDVVVHLVSTPANLAPHAHQQTDRIRRACDLAAPCFGALLDELSPDILVYDFIQPWAEAEARGVPAFHFATCGAVATAFFIHCLKTDRPPSAFPFESIGLCGVNKDTKYTTLVAVREDSTALVVERDRLPLSLERSSGFVAVKSCADIERKCMDYLSQLLGKQIIPTVPLLVNSGGSEDQRDGGRIMRWLDGEEPGSVVFVSFGSEYFMSEHQIAQMARGLELSGVARVSRALLAPCVTCALCSLRAKRQAGVVACRGGGCRGVRPARRTGLQLWGARYVFAKMPRRQRCQINSLTSQPDKIRSSTVNQ